MDSALHFLNIVIGLVFIFFIFSLVSSAVMEAISRWFAMRSKNLQNWIRETFAEGNLGDEIMQHGFVRSLTRKNRRPSYIPSDVFTQALLDLLSERSNKGKNAEHGTGDNNDLLGNIKETLDDAQLPLNDDLRRIFRQLAEEADQLDLEQFPQWQSKLEAFRKKIENWYDNAMDRVSGVFKKKTQWILLGISFVLAFGLKVDTISITKYLYNNPAQATVIADHVSENIDALDPAKMDSLAFSERKAAIKGELQQIHAAGIPLGWTQVGGFSDWTGIQWWEFIMALLGMLLSTFAISLGAPFWYDMINKLSNIRNSGSKPRSSLQENSPKGKNKPGTG